MRLFEHPEFEQVVVRAARHFHTSEQFVEKDYYVTEILRIVSHEFGGQTVFKGGTSLSKGWGLITRFSEGAISCSRVNSFRLSMTCWPGLKESARSFS